MKKQLQKFRNVITSYISIAFLILAIVTVDANAQALTGTKTIPGDYSSIALAVTDLNTNGVGTGGVVFNIASGYTETIGATISVTATGTSANPIIFQKNGTGANPLITAHAGANLASSTTTVDGIWNFVGSDYVTVDGIDLLDLNTNTIATSMMEYGYGFYRASATNGANNNTIKNCTITLNRDNTTTATGTRWHGSVAIELVAATPAAVGTNITATSLAGASSNNKFYSNTIQNCNGGIALGGVTYATPYTLADFNNDVGGTSALTGNTIINFGGGTGAANACMAVWASNQWGFNISYNTVNNNTGTGTNHPNTNRGIFAAANSIGASANINNNNVTIAGGTSTSAIDWGIDCEMAQSGTAGNTININNNVLSMTKTAVSTVAFTAIWVNSAATTVNVNGNRITTFVYGGTGTSECILSQLAGIGTLNINNNYMSGVSLTAASGNHYNIGVTASVTTALNITGDTIDGVVIGGTSSSKIFRGLYTSTAASTCAHNISNNIFQNISNAGATPTGAFALIYAGGSPASWNINNNKLIGSLTLPTTGDVYLIYNGQSTSLGVVNNNNLTGTGITRSGASGATYGYYNASGPTGTFTFNTDTVSNITVTGSGLLYGIYLLTSVSCTQKIQNCLFSNLTTGSGILYGINHNYGNTGSEISNNRVTILKGNGTVAAINIGSTASITMNVFKNIIDSITTTGASAVSGILHSAGTLTSIYQNKIYNITGNNAGASAFGINITGGSTVTAHNNLIGDVKTPLANAAIPLAGINVTGASTVNLYYNSIYLTATSSGALFGSAALNASTSVALTVRNNIFINLSVPVGAGLTAAYRRSSTTISSYNVASNGNLFYAGTPGSNNLIFHDGTNSDQTILDYRTRMVSRDQGSFSSNPIFNSIIPSDANYLEINNSTPTQLESSGGNISGITTDFTGTIRAGNPGYLTQVNGGGLSPDVGAWEFDGIPAAPAIGTLSITPGVQCVAAPHTVTTTVIPNLGTTSTVDLNYSFNGVVQTPVSMTNISGNTWQGVIPAATSPTNAVVTYSITATNSGSITSAKGGTAYADEPLNGSSVIINATKPTICLGSSASLRGTVGIAGTVAVGSGATTSATYPNPFYSLWSNTHNQYLIRASELTAAQLAPGNITALAVEITAGTLVMQDFSIKMANTTAADVSSFLAAPFVTVFTAATVTPVSGVNTLTFSTPFVWDGTSNIVIEVCHGNSASSATMNSTALVDNTTYTSTIHAHKSAASAGSITCTDLTTNLSTYTIRPKFTFTGVKGAPMSSFSWSDGTSTVGTTNPLIVSPIVTTNYTLTATDLNGCSLTTTLPYTVNVINTTLSGLYTVGASGNYPTITSAMNAYSNACTISGPVIFELLDATYNAASGETFPIIVSGNTQASVTKTLTIRPAPGVTSTIIGNGAAIIRLDSARFVTIDGRQGGTGTPKSLILQNDSIKGGAVTFINDAKRNIIQYADLRGASNDPTIGVVNFSTGLVNGNDSNIIDNCDIHDAVSTPASLIQASGSTSSLTAYNDYITISNCNIYNFWNGTAEGNAFKISNGNNNWTITGNSIYQTVSRTGTTGYYVFNFQHSGNFAALNGMVITNNYIGGSGPMCSGTWVQTGGAANQNTYFNMGNVAKSKFSNNTMANFNFTTTSTSATGSGVFNMVQYVNGMLDIDSNTFGIMTDSNSIVVVGGNGGAVIAIAANASNTAGTYSISGNKFGGFKVNGGTSSSNSIAVISITSAANNITYNIDNNIIGNAITNNIIAWPSTGSGVQGVVGILNSSSANLRIRNNIIRNLTNLYYGAVGSSVTTGINSSAGIDTITGNQIYALVNYASGQSNSDNIAAINGISCSQTTAGNLISRNKIYGLLELNGGAATVTVNGINVSGMTASTVSRNLIHSLSTEASGILAGVMGINYASGTITLTNNMIRLGLDSNGASMVTTPTIRGINKKGGNISAYFNSVYIGGSGVGTGIANSYGFIRTATGTDDVKNNIFMNERSNSSFGNGNGGAHFAFGTNNATTFTADYNLYYVNSSSNGDTLAQSGTTSYASIALWKSTVGLDGNSISGNPAYAAPTNGASTLNLHIAGATPVESAGIPIATVTEDYDGDVRASLTPTDLGADAGNFTLSDISGPAISYVNFSVDTVSSQRVLTGLITITDPSNVDVLTNKPRIYYKKKSDADAFLGNTSTDNGWKYVIATNSISPFNFEINYSILNGGSISVGDTILYFVVAQDALANIGANPGAGMVAGSVGSVITAPTTPNQYIIKGNPLRGTYLVGAGQTTPNFATITAAVAKINDVGIGAAVVFSLLDPNYDGTTETFPITINQYAGASVANTLTIKPASTISSTITGSSASAIIVLNGADYVTINGSNNGSTSRNLTIENSNTSTTSAVVWGQTAALGDSVTHNTIMNTIITGNAPTTTLLGIGFGSSAISLTSVGVNNNANTIQNCSFSKSQNGIYMGGTSIVIKDKGNKILNNMINAAAPNNLIGKGIYVAFQDAIQISGNTVGNITNTATVMGISLGNNTTNVYAPTGSEVTNAFVSANIVGPILSTGATSAYGISVVPATSGTNIIQNNMVSEIQSNATPSDICIGIYVGGGTGSSTKLYFNTVYLSGNTSTRTTPNCYALAIGSGDPVVDIRNNILVNRQTTSGTGSSYAIGLGSSSFTNLTLDYNNYHVAGANGQLAVTGSIGATGTGTNYNVFSAFKTATGKDVHSINDSTRFVSTANLHLATGTLGNIIYSGTPIAGITTDIDGDARVPLYPYIGADENTTSPLPVKLTSFVATAKANGALLNWITASEINNKGFEVERSVDGRNFLFVDFVKGAGNSTRTLSYSLTDAKAFALSNVVYYRLKQVDFDGKSTYSNVVRVSKTAGEVNALSLFPNPYATDYSISFTAINDGKASVEMLDIQGKTVASFDADIISGANTLSIVETADMKPGIYFVRITVNGEVQTLKLVKN